MPNSTSHNMDSDNHTYPPNSPNQAYKRRSKVSSHSTSFFYSTAEPIATVAVAGIVVVTTTGAPPPPELKWDPVIVEEQSGVGSL